MWLKLVGGIAATGTGLLAYQQYNSDFASLSERTQAHASIFSEQPYDSHGLQNYKQLDCKTKKFKLLYVSVFARHGARTPNYFVNSKYTMPDWRGENGLVNLVPELNYPTDTKLLPEKSLISDDQLFEEFRKVTPHSLTGQLTLIGQEQSLSFGKQLKKIYRDFLAGPFYEDEIILRSTMFPRTYYSLKGIISGMYGNQFSKCQRPIIHTSLPKNETFYPNPQVCSAIKGFIPPGSHLIAQDNEVIKMKCILRDILGVPRLEEIDPSMVSATSIRVKTAEVDPCAQYYQKAPEEEKKEEKAGPKLSRDLTIYAVRDDFHSREIHKFPIPADLNTYHDEIDRLSSKEILFEYMGDEKDWKDKISLLVSPVFNYIISDFDKMAVQQEVKKASCTSGIFESLDKEKVKTKMQISSVHDTTLIPMLAALGLYRAKWPGFMSNIILELYEEVGTDQYYVRTLYNGVQQRLKLDEAECIPNEYNNMGLVNYTKFKKALKDFSVADDRYISSCDKAAKLFSNHKPVLKDQFDY